VSPLGASGIVFACVLGGTFFGIFLRGRLPEDHLSGATKDVVRLGTGLIGTIAALVLGLLIGSANSTYQTQSSQIQQLTADIVGLDHTLTQYGPEADSVRKLLRRAVPALADRIWRDNGSDSRKAEPFEASAAGLSVYDEILKLSPRDDTQRSLQARAIDAAQDLAKTRLLLFAEAGMTIPMPFLVVLVSWLAIIFASFSLFADSNATTIGALGVFALSASASIFLILELSQPFTGLMMISSEQLRNALAPLT
jgi:ABC-type multidrug transport system fused ATPase/permease subunit